MRRAFAVLGVLAALPGVAHAAPEDPGPETPSKSTFDVPVGSGVTLKTDVYLPGALQHAPLVVLRHGYLRGRGNLGGWGTHLASHGFVTVVFDSRDNFTDDPVVDGADLASVVAWAEAQSADAASPLHDRVDSTRVAVGGHSAGGAAAVVAASALPETRALVLLDSEDTAPSLSAAASLDVPTLGVFGAASSCNENGDNQKTYAAVAGPHLGVYVKGASHCDAEDPLDPLCAIACGSTDDARHAEFKRYATAFLSAYLQCDASAYPYLGGAAATSDTAVTILPATSGVVLPPAACMPDAGVVDAGLPSGGGGHDGGTTNEGDAGQDADGGALDASSSDASGCACRAAPRARRGLALAWVAAAVLAFSWRRRARRVG